MVNNNKNIENTKNRKNDSDIRNGGLIMAVLSKPLDVAFVVRENKVEEFMNRKKDNSKKLKKILQRAKKIEGNIVHKE